ncbi:MAG: hypothetical protein ACP5U1_01650 [Desulfomonilaceae bacterium]
MIDYTKTILGSLILCALIFIVALLVISHREQGAEWKSYQLKGISLAIETLEHKLDTKQEERKQKLIKAKISELKRLSPQVIEITPFRGKAPAEFCMTCHFGIEDTSTSHPNSIFGCVVCHGGVGSDLTVKGAHRGLLGGRNPSRLNLASQSCGGNSLVSGMCHTDKAVPILDHVRNTPRSLMSTNAGIIGILRFQWGVANIGEEKYGITSVSDNRHELKEIGSGRSTNGTVNLAENHFRKFCSTCHLWGKQPEEKMGRLEGCAACHAIYGEDGRYQGADPTINRQEVGHAAYHSINTRIPDERCRACHNRSARIGLNYHGEMESEQYGTPFMDGFYNDQTLSDDRFVLRLVPDIHFEKKMGCIDCHTAQDTMGDGKIYGRMKDQVEIRCEDCHGGYKNGPVVAPWDPNDALTLALMRSSKFIKLSESDMIVRTSKGRPLPNIKKTEKGLVLTSKLSGNRHLVKVITGDRLGHSIKGHERLECDTCHSAWSPQCYGCHQLLNFEAKGKDHLTGKMSAGLWTEGRSFFRFEKNILGINSRGRVGILVPGCQVWNTVVDGTGKVIAPYDSKIMPLRNGMNSIAIGSTHPHTTRKEVPRCVDCHFDPKSIGLGEGAIAWDPKKQTVSMTPIYDSLTGGLQIRFPLDAIVDTNGNQMQGTSHILSRGFNKNEIHRILEVVPCLPCHDRYDDPVWSKPGPYRKTPLCIKPPLSKGDQERPKHLQIVN